MRPIGDNFGGRAVELSGIIVDPSHQQHGIGTTFVQEFIATQRIDILTAYTRNPSILRVLEDVSHTDDVLARDPERVAEQLSYATVHNDIVYHLDRYGPNGLYGLFDPASRVYNGQILRERCELLDNPNNALAVAVHLKGTDGHE